MLIGIIVLLLVALPVTGKIAFSSDRDGDPAEVYVMNDDGTNVERLTYNSGNDYVGSWSPDGTKIVFIYPWICLATINVDGTGQTCIPNTPGGMEGDSNPSWSPDGKKIVFESHPNGNSEIFTINLDGSDKTQLTFNSYEDVNPAFSPEGSKIVFSSDRDGNYEIYVMNTDGSSQMRLTDNVAYDNDASWSPDGQHIAFQSGLTGGGDIYILKLDDMSVTRLTDDPAIDYDPVWSPDSTQIAFVSMRDGYRNIYKMNADGNDIIKLTNTQGYNFAPAWAFPGEVSWSFPLTNMNSWENRDYYGFWTPYSDGYYHLGIDYIANANDEVRAIADGIVFYEGMHTGYGSSTSNSIKGGIIVITHTASDGTIFNAQYAHLNDFTVKEGDPVSRNQLIGHIISYNPDHLHFGIYTQPKFPNAETKVQGRVKISLYDRNPKLRDNLQYFVDPSIFLTTYYP